MSFVAGPYAWTFAGRPLGVVEDGVQLTIRKLGAPVVADAFGGQPVDYIQQGLIGSMDVVFQEFDALGVQYLLDTYSGASFGQIGNLGCPGVDISANVLCGERLPFANCTSPNVIIAYRAAIPPDFDLSLLFGSRLRNVPVRFNLYPYEREIGSDNLHIVELLSAKPGSTSFGSAASIKQYLAAKSSTTGTSSAMTALPIGNLYTSQLFNVGGVVYQWSPLATSGAFEPDDKSNPGVDPGYWVIWT